MHYFFICSFLKIFVKGPEFIKEHSSDTVAFWLDAKEPRKGGNGRRRT